MNLESAEGRGTQPKYHRDDGSQQMAERRKRFEHWYTVNAFDYARNPIGSERCDIQWHAWLGAEKSAARITGMRVIDGVHVLVSQPSSELLEEQLLVRYEDYIKLVNQCEVEELRADALRLVEAAQPFATFNSSEPTITVRTPNVARLRAMLHAMRVRLTGTSER